eukprot:GHVO01057574.1.p1 GENE.GHVO01057574.1~~GHVO01057574.1.p1  ORF type:complete len:433 (-),score=56.52 GHVO01057574.1:213-1511(-)
MTVADSGFYLHRLIERPQPMAETHDQDPAETMEYLRSTCRVLVVGAGGLGCEILKGLCMSGFKNIDVIDMDNVDVTNLNRQFLFRRTDIGRSKAVAAAAFVNHRCRSLGVAVRAHTSRVQDMDISFYKQFNIVISGLDNTEARRFLNSMMHSLVEINKEGDVDVGSIIPYLDGGTEGMKGQSRVILPTMTSCFECSLETLTPKVTYPLCTIAETPRLPEHCIEYALVVLWTREFPSTPIDTDNPGHIDWLFNEALSRASVYGIDGVTRMLTLGVVRRIIPAVAATNSVIAASVVNEALKLSIYCAPVMNNYMLYNGEDGVHTLTFPYEKVRDCLVCGGDQRSLELSPTKTLEEVLGILAEAPFHLLKPSLSTGNGIVFLQNPPALRAMHEYKLKMKIQDLAKTEELMSDEQEIAVTDASLQKVLYLRVKWKK